MLFSEKKWIYEKKRFKNGGTVQNFEKKGGDGGWKWWQKKMREKGEKNRKHKIVTPQKKKNVNERDG